VPQTAVMNSGERQVVFIDRGNGYYQPRQVTLGAQTDGRLEILSGLAEGERVVTSGSFLVDSESQMTDDRRRTSAPQGAGHDQLHH